MHYLYLNVFGHALTPELGPVEASGFAFQYLHIRAAYYLPVDVGEHPRMLRMLKHSVDLAYFVAGASLVLRGYNRLQHHAPEHGSGVIIRVRLGQLLIPVGFLQLKIQLRYIDIETNGR